MLKIILNVGNLHYICSPKSPQHRILVRRQGKKGRLAQLVQSTCLTSRGSLVRTQYLPQKSLTPCGAFSIHLSCVRKFGSRPSVVFRRLLSVLDNGKTPPFYPLHWALADSAEASRPIRNTAYPASHSRKSFSLSRLMVMVCSKGTFKCTENFRDKWCDASLIASRLIRNWRLARKKLSPHCCSS